MNELKNTVESILFSTGRKLELEELSKLCKIKDLEQLKLSLNELKQELDQKNSSLMLVEEGSSWKLTVREKYLPYVRKVVSQTELSKSILETLAVIAYKAPTLQSQIIKIRTNKAYAHLDELEQNGYITREKKGRTKLLKLSQKFFDYFDIPPDQLKQKLEKVVSGEETLEPKNKNNDKQTAKLESQEENLLKILDLVSE